MERPEIKLVQSLIIDVTRNRLDGNLFVIANGRITVEFLLVTDIMLV